MKHYTAIITWFTLGLIVSTGTAANAQLSISVPGGAIALVPGNTQQVDFVVTNMSFTVSFDTAALAFNGELDATAPVAVTAVDVDGPGMLFDGDGNFGEAVSGGGTLWEASTGVFAGARSIPANGGTAIIGRLTFDVPIGTPQGNYGTVILSHPIAGNTSLGPETGPNVDFTNSFNIVVVPEPSSALYLSLAVLGICFRRRR